MPPSPMPGLCVAFRLCGVPTWLHWSFPGVGLGIGVPAGLASWWLAPDAAWAMFGWTALAVAVVVLVHEAGHVVAARLLGIEIEGLSFAAGGGCCLIGETDAHWRDLLYSGAGLLSQTVLAVVLWPVAGLLWPLTPSPNGAAVLAAANALLLVINAWPSGHSDGMRIVRAWRAMRGAR